MGNDGGQGKDPFADHRLFVDTLRPLVPARNSQVMSELRWKQPGRFRRVRNTLIGFEVVRFQGRGGSARLALGERDLDEALAAGVGMHVGREIDLYPLLLDPIDRLVTGYYPKVLQALITDADGTDGVEPYVTSAKRTGAQTGAFTRPDVTVVVDLTFPSLGPWNDVHAVEVKPYWSVARDGLFEAAAQAALRRCTHSWLVAHIPPVTAPGLDRAQRAAITQARSLIGTPAQPGTLSLEAGSIGVGIAVATGLAEDATLEQVVSPARQVMDPERADELFASLDRVGG